MCGICGYTNPQEIDATILQKMNSLMNHRGPDGEGTYFDKGIALGHKRLSLIDLTHGNQPMIRPRFHEEDIQESTISGDLSDYVIVFNGEIYNYQTIRRELEFLGYSFETQSDTEVLLTGYMVWGKDVLLKLRGMFAFAIWDSYHQELFLARDYFGIKPLYYAQKNGRVIFASEIKALLAHPDIKKELNEEALKHYLSFQYSVLPETFFKGIFKLPPAHYALVTPDQKIIIEQYWKLSFEPEKQTLDEAADSIHQAMQESISYHLVADVEVASFLSSGVDSSYITACLHDQKQKTKAFTVGFEIDGEDSYSEIEEAQKTGDFLEIDHLTHTIQENEFWDSLEKIQWHMDEPCADPACIALYFVDKEASKHVKAVLSGEGADEFFGGYSLYQTPLANAKLNAIPRSLLKQASWLLEKWGLRGANYLKRASTPLEEQFIGNANIFSEQERISILKNCVHAVPPHTLLRSSYEQVEEHDDVVKMQYIDINHWLVGDILLKTDKMSMAHSIESRVPFLDIEVWAAARKLSRKNKVNSRTTKRALRKAASKILPERFCSHPKKGFPVPIRVWLKEDKYQNIIKESFTSDTAKKYFNIGSLLSLLQEHREGNADNSRKIWTVYMFLVWHQVYFEDSKETKFFDTPLSKFGGIDRNKMPISIFIEAETSISTGIQLLK